MRRVGLVVLVVLLFFATPAMAQTSQSVTVEVPPEDPGGTELGTKE